MAGGRGDEVWKNRPGVPEIVRPICLVAICASWSVTVNVGVNKPFCVVVPEIVPSAGSIEYPVGRPMALKAYVPPPVPPVGAIVTPLWYATPAVPLGKDVVAMDSSG